MAGGSGGVFLSTDPVKRIGPGWKPVANAYAEGNPLSYNDPDGKIALALEAFYEIEQRVLRPVNSALDLAEARTAVFAHTMSQADYHRYASEWAKKSLLEVGVDQLAPGAGKWAAPLVTQSPIASYGDTVRGYVPLQQTWDFSVHLANIDRNLGQGIGNILHNALFPSSSRVTLNSPTAGTTPMAVLSGQSGQPQAPSFQLIASGGSGPGGNLSLSSRTAGAGSYAQTLNSFQPTTPAAASSTGSSGSSATSQIVNRVSNAVSTASNSITQAVRNVAATVSQAITSAVTSIGNFFSGIFGGRRGP